MKKPRTPPPFPTPFSLNEAALSYVARFAATEASLRRVLSNRIRKGLLLHPAQRGDAANLNALKTAIENIIEKLCRVGAVDDAAYAGMKARSLRRAGRSARFIQQKLNQKGVAQDLAQTVLNDSDGDLKTDAADRQAALIFAKRKKLGRFRPQKPGLDTDQLRKQHQRDMAAMARNGFSFATAKQALGEGDEEAEAD